MEIGRVDAALSFCRSHELAHTRVDSPSAPDAPNEFGPAFCRVFSPDTRRSSGKKAARRAADRFGNIMSGKGSDKSQLRASDQPDPLGLFVRPRIGRRRIDLCARQLRSEEKSGVESYLFGVMFGSV